METYKAHLVAKGYRQHYGINYVGINFLLWQCSQSWNMYFDKIRMYGFIENREKPYIYKWANGFLIIFFVLYVDDILLIKNDVLLYKV